MADPAEILEFWLEEVDPKFWYQSNTDLDAEITERFYDSWLAACDGGLNHWIEGALGSLAFILLTDQFPRNMFRSDPRAFRSDALALFAAQKATEQLWDLDVPAPERQFFYLPYEHSEDLALQDHCIELISTRLPDEVELLLHAKAHRLIINDFGRFPYRNSALGRDSTSLEEVFLQKGGYVFALESVKLGSF